MTEEIIIDGVDVAGCCLYLKDNGKCLRLLTDNEPETECNAICDYGCLYHKEQLIRLEQENKELKEAKDKYYQQTLDDEILMNELSLEVDLRKKESDFYLEKLSKYRSALEKIRDLCIHYENTNDKCITNCYAHFIVTDLIQNKINGVLNDN